MTEQEANTGDGLSGIIDTGGLSRDRPWLLPSNRKLRHLQGISLRNLTLSRPVLQGIGRTTDDTSLPNALRTPTKALAQRETHKLEHSRSSNDLKISPLTNGTANKQKGEILTVNGPSARSKRPGDQKLRRRSTLNWTNALPEVRHKKLENVAAERLTNTWFSLHCTGTDKPLYISEVVERAMNPSFRSFDLSSYGAWVTRRDDLIVKYWAQPADTSDYFLLVELQVHLRSLQFIGKSLENFRHPLPHNCILFHLTDGIYTSFTDLPLNESLATTVKPIRSHPPTVEPSSSFDALMRLSNLDDCIQDALSTRQKLSRQIEAFLDEQESARSTVTSATLAAESLASTNRSLAISRRSLRNAFSRRSEVQTSLMVRREAMTLGAKSQEKAVVTLESARTHLGLRLSRRKDTNSAVQGQVRRISEDLLQLYPIESVPNKALNFTICGISLPNATSLLAPETDPLAIAAALGYAAHLTHLLSLYLSTPLPYPLTPLGSTSTIYDAVSSSLHSTQSRTLPLYSKGAVAFRFEYGVFLLNSDVETLMARQGIKLVDQRHTAGNLKMLLSVLTSGEGNAPERKKGTLRGLVRTDSAEQSPSRERNGEEEWTSGLQGELSARDRLRLQAGLGP